MSLLTKRQSEILALITSFTQTKGYSPSYRELMQALGLSSPATLHKHIKNLEKEGHIKPIAGQKRALSKAAKPPSSHSLAIIGSISKGQKIELYAKSILVEVPKSFASSLYGFMVRDTSFASNMMQKGDVVIVETRSDPASDALILAHSKQDGAQILRYAELNDSLQMQGVITGLLRRY
jgi:repressor LexA